MELRNIVAFVRVSELQSFSRAAEQLGYSQSAVTVQVRQLEQELGAALFERIGKNIRLTQAGQRLLPRALEILTAVRRAEGTMRDPQELTGRLRVGTAESLLTSVLPPVFIEFSCLCPRTEVSTHTALVQKLFDMVRQNEIDLLYFLDQRTNFPEWVKVAERREQAFFVASAESPLAGEKAIPLERLMGEAFLLTERGISYRYTMEQQLARRGLELHPFLETGNTDLITRLLLQNRGISFLPEFVVREELEQGRLVRLDVDCPPIEMWSQLVYHRDKAVTPQMERFMEVLLREMGAERTGGLEGGTEHERL